MKAPTAAKLRSYLYTVSTLLLLVCLLHLLRAALGWDLVLGGWEAPVWLSVLVLGLTGSLSFSGFYMANNMK